MIRQQDPRPHCTRMIQSATAPHPQLSVCGNPWIICTADIHKSTDNLVQVTVVQYYYTATAAKHVMVIANVAKQVLSVPHYVNLGEDVLIMTIAECARVYVKIKGKSKKSEIDHIAF